MNKKENNNLKINIETIDGISEILSSISEINDCEYVYMDSIDFNLVNEEFLNNKIFITKLDKDFVMFEKEDFEEKELINKIQLNYPQLVDLMILNKNSDESSYLNNFIDKDTLIIKNLGYNVIIIEDKRNEVNMLLTKYEKIIFKGSGLNTRIIYYENIASKK